MKLQEKEEEKKKCVCVYGPGRSECCLSDGQEASVSVEQRVRQCESDRAR